MGRQQHVFGGATRPFVAIALSITIGIGASAALALSSLAAPAAAAGPSVIVSPTSGLSWGDTITVTASGYPTQEATYIALCDPGTIGTLEVEGQVPAACAGELEHRLESGFNPDTDYGFINGANGSDTVVLTDGRPSSAHCATGTCDVVVFTHNCLDFITGGTCNPLSGQTITFAGSSGGSSVAFPVPGGSATLATSAGTIDSVGSTPVDPATNPPGGWAFPYGVIHFTITGLTKGATITVTLTLPGPVSQYFKFQQGVYFAFGGATFSGNQVVLTLTDGGSGDGDLTADGSITDPGLPARHTSGGQTPSGGTTTTPTTSSPGSSTTSAPGSSAPAANAPAAARAVVSAPTFTG